MSLDLPLVAGAEREQAILSLVLSGNIDPIEWATITSDYNGHHAEFSVFGDALKSEGVRLNVTAKTQQAIADSLDCIFLTPKLADLMWLQRTVTLKPCPLGASKDMGSTATMLKHSQAIDAQLNALGNPTGLISTVGKIWAIDNDLLKLPNRALNYGWHFDGQSFQGSTFEVTASRLQDDKGRFLRLIQGKGTRHDMNHVDYSQIIQLVSLNCTVDGQDMRLDDLLKEPNLAPLANIGGRLDVLRQPGA